MKRDYYTLTNYAQSTADFVVLVDYIISDGIKCASTDNASVMFITLLTECLNIDVSRKELSIDRFDYRKF